MTDGGGRRWTRGWPSGVAWLVAAAVAAAPLFAAPGSEPPFGRPWYLGRGLLAAALVLVLQLLPADGGSRERTRRLSALLFLVCYLALVSNDATLGSGDNLPNRWLPAALLAGDGLDLGHVAPAELRDHYSLVKVDGRLLSAFPLGTGLLATPYLALDRFVAGAAGERSPGLDERGEKHLAALLVALSAVLLLLALHDPIGLGRAAVASFAFVLCTPLLYDLGQALWSQTGELFCLSLALLLLRRDGIATAVAGGLAAGCAYLCRPTALLLLPLLFLIPEPRSRRRTVFAVVAAGSIALAVGFDLALYGHPLGGYGLLNAAEVPWRAAGFAERLAGVLASPSRGALWFLPALFVAAWIARRSRETPAGRLYAPALATAAAVVLLAASYEKWWGGSSIGPRLLAEAALPFALLLGLALGAAKRGGAVALALLCALQAGLGFGLAHSTGAREWSRMVMPDENRAILWSLRNSQIASILPGWYFEPRGPYLNPVVHPGPDRRRWRPIDLSATANGRYDLPPGDRSAPSWRSLYLPRLGPEAETLEPDAPLRFLPPGAPNLVRVCRGEPARVIAIPDLPVRRLLATVAWRAAVPSAETDVVGALRIRFRGGREERRWLRDNRDVFDTESQRRRIVLPAHRIAAAHSWSHDALFLQRYTLSGEDRRLDSIELVGSPGDRDGCLFLLALSVSAD